MRQWSTLHPEFSYLPRKFKIAVTGAPADRAASQVHDIGLHLKRDADGELGFEVLVGGGLGRTPIIGHVIREFLPREHLLSYLEAILRIYNEHRPARQPQQGAHQDPGEDAGHRRSFAGASKRSGQRMRDQRAAGSMSARSERMRALLRAAALRSVRPIST